MPAVHLTKTRALLDELIAVADKDARTVTADPMLAVTHAWFMRCIDCVRAALLLDDHGQSGVAYPLVRSAIEHAVGIFWRHATGPDALAALARSHKRWAANIRTAINTSNQLEQQAGRKDWSPALDAVFDKVEAELLPEGSVDGERKIENRFKVARKFDLYVTWLSETATSHASEESANPYLVAQSDRYVLLRSPRTAADTLVLRCASIAVAAFRAMGDACGSDVWRANVDRLDDELGRAIAAAVDAGILDPTPREDWLSRFDC